MGSSALPYLQLNEITPHPISYWASAISVWRSIYTTVQKVWGHLEMSLFFKEKHCFFNINNIN